MRTPLLVVTGVDPVAIDSAMVSLAWDLPGAVTVRHRIDPVAQVLTRTVSDVTGVLETAQVHLEHACVSCALREDILPTLDRLASQGRWSTIVAGLPTGTQADRLSQAATRDSRLARRLRLVGVVAALCASDVPRDLLGDDLLRERGVHTGPDDDRGVGEVGCALVERADVVVLDADPGPARQAALDLLTALARPGVRVAVGAETLEAGALVETRRENATVDAWAGPVLDVAIPPLTGGLAWRLDLRADRAFHPERLMEQIERLGGGSHRSRGSFWLPTRPHALQQWDGSGGQLSVGPLGSVRTPATRLLLTGLGAPPPGLREAFAELLLTPAEASLPASSWDWAEDGLEPWLGDLRDAA